LERIPCADIRTHKGEGKDGILCKARNIKDLPQPPKAKRGTDSLQRERMALAITVNSIF
jgi:hypothetical protein